MAKIYSAGDGTLLRMLQTPDEEQQYGAHPGTVFTLLVDESTNSSVLNAINQDWNNHTLISGTLFHNGIPVQITASSVLYNDRQQLATLRQTVKDYVTDSNLDAYLNASSPTLAQTAAALKLTIQAQRALIRIVGIIIDFWLKRLGQN